MLCTRMIYTFFYQVFHAEKEYAKKIFFNDTVFEKIGSKVVKTVHIWHFMVLAVQLLQKF